MGLDEKLFKWALDVGFDVRTATNFFKTLGKYLETGEAPRWWVERCKELNILDEKGRLILLEGEELNTLLLSLLGLVWMGLVKRTIISEKSQEMK